MKEGVSAMARLFLFIPFPVETWRAASLCIKYIINQCICALRNINHSFIIVYIINQCICALPYKTFTYIETRHATSLRVCVEMMCKLWMIVWGLENNLYIREIINKTCNYEGL